MDLTSGCPFSLVQSGLLATYSSLPADLACDVAVIGGGISGALIAYHLVEAGVNCALIDREDFGHGSTSASTGLLQYELDTPLYQLINLFGEKKAVRSYKACQEANEKIGALISTLDDDCGYARRNSLCLASTRKHVKGLAKEFACRKRHGFRVEFFERARIEDLFSFSRSAAIWSLDAAQVDAYRMTHALIRRASGRGLKAFARTNIERRQQNKGAVVLITDRQRRITCKRIVVATGYEAEGFLRRGRVELKSTYAIATQPLATFEGWHERCLIWETARPYLYICPTPDGRAMIGGEDENIVHAVKRDRLIKKKSRILQERFQEMFPVMEVETAYRWAGTFAETADGLPFIGECDEFRGGYFALGYGANGITFSMLAAEIIRDLVLGRGHPDAEIFSFQR